MPGTAEALEVDPNVERRRKHRDAARRSRKRKAEREAYAKRWAGFSFEAICETAGFSSPQSCLGPDLWNKAVSSYFEGSQRLIDNHRSGRMRESDRWKY